MYAHKAYDIGGEMVCVCVRYSYRVRFSGLILDGRKRGVNKSLVIGGVGLFITLFLRPILKYYRTCEIRLWPDRAPHVRCIRYFNTARQVNMRSLEYILKISHLNATRHRHRWTVDHRLTLSSIGPILYYGFNHMQWVILHFSKYFVA
jgi:hypothetical protein